MMASEIDLLCAGFPCQSFSNIGKKGGLEDPRGALIYQVMRVLKDKQPRAFLLENVKGLLSRNTGETFNAIKGGLEDYGCALYHDVLEAKDFGVPQIRKRLFVLKGRTDREMLFRRL